MRIQKLEKKIAFLFFFHFIIQFKNKFSPTLLNFNSYKQLQNAAQSSFSSFATSFSDI